MRFKQSTKITVVAKKSVVWTGKIKELTHRFYEKDATVKKILNSVTL